MVDGIYGCSGGFQAPSAACARGAIVLAMFSASDCLPGRPAINGRCQFEVKMQLKGRKISEKRVRKGGYRASCNDGAPNTGCPLCPCQNCPPPTTPPPASQPPSHLAKVDWQTAVTQPDLRLVRKPFAGGSSSSASCSLSCLLRVFHPSGRLYKVCSLP